MKKNWETYQEKLILKRATPYLLLYAIYVFILLMGLILLNWGQNPYNQAVDPNSPIQSVVHLPINTDKPYVEWGKSNWVNPPFRKSDGQKGKGPTAFIRKAIEENKKGKDVVVIINTNAFINMLIEAGAEMRAMGRVKWLDGKTGEAWKSPSCTTLFILKGKK